MRSSLASSRRAAIRCSSTGRATPICRGPCSIKAKRAGVVINPATPASVLEEILPELDQVLVMTVNPGFGNQSFMHSTLAKIRRVRTMIDEVNPGCDLEVDGGINVTTAPLVVDAGANVLVAGSAILAPVTEWSLRSSGCEPRSSAES